jgi:hypothetical protein
MLWCGRPGARQQGCPAPPRRAPTSRCRGSSKPSRYGILYRRAGPVVSVVLPRVIRVGMRLRALEDDDLDRLFEWERDPGAVAMAAFTRANPSDRAAFDGHYQRIRNDPDCTLLAIDADGAFVGTIGSFTMAGERELTYWIDHPGGVEDSPRQVSKRSCRSRRRDRCSHESPHTTSAPPRSSPELGSCRWVMRPPTPMA